ncbi:hypothetical protein [Xenorhabdus innexi]|uniref:Uncharacterized protein n=1 Tax=Xenorhabdus innexi TaxID=290109 RepID=A0A1N6N108_9GAMM|nr:hypothetical protein [Xenorhabdus innexi]PHM31324.1 hypothetical protein Xinn_02870 [Xenorhabdus innexi]SIP74776.1 conserved hypothetical protein [Xenorhabdus innexi]
MKTEMLVGDKEALKNVMELNEEMQAILLPLLTAVENEANSDTHAMLRAVYRLSMSQYKDLDTLNNNLN